MKYEWDWLVGLKRGELLVEGGGLREAGRLRRSEEDDDDHVRLHTHQETRPGGNKRTDNQSTT